MGTQSNWPQISEEEYEAGLEHYVECYIRPQENPHGLFAERLGVTRQRAKEIAFAIPYKYRGFNYNLSQRKVQEMSVACRLIKAMADAAGDDLTVYQIWSIISDIVDEGLKTRKLSPKVTKKINELTGQPAAPTDLLKSIMARGKDEY